MLIPCTCGVRPIEAVASRNCSSLSLTCTCRSRFVLRRTEIYLNPPQVRQYSPAVSGISIPCLALCKQHADFILWQLTNLVIWCWSHDCWDNASLGRWIFPACDVLSCLPAYAILSSVSLGSDTVVSERLEHGCLMIYASFPRSLVLGLEDRGDYCRGNIRKHLDLARPPKSKPHAQDPWPWFCMTLL